MTPAKPWPSVLVALISSLLCWVLLDMWTGSGGTRPPLSWAAPACTLALAVVLLVAGWPVRRWVREARKLRPAGPAAQRKRLDPIVAARTAVLAKAAAYGGSVLVGWYVGQAAVLLPDLVGVRGRDLVVALVAVLTAVLLVVAGFVVQHWCRVPPEDGPDSDRGTDDLSAGRSAP